MGELQRGEGRMGMRGSASWCGDGRIVGLQNYAASFREEEESLMGHCSIYGDAFIKIGKLICDNLLVYYVSLLVSNLLTFPPGKTCACRVNYYISSHIKSASFLLFFGTRKSLSIPTNCHTVNVSIHPSVV